MNDLYNLVTDAYQIAILSEDIKYKKIQEVLCRILFPQWDEFRKFIFKASKKTEKEATPTSFLASIYGVEPTIMGKILNQLKLYKNYKEREGVMNDCCNVPLNLK